MRLLFVLYFCLWERLLLYNDNVAILAWAGNVVNPSFFEKSMKNVITH